MRYSRGTQLVPEVKENHQASVNHGSQLTVEGRGRRKRRVLERSRLGMVLKFFGRSASEALCISRLNARDQVNLAQVPVMLSGHSQVSRGGFAILSTGKCPPLQSSNDSLCTTAPEATYNLDLSSSSIEYNPWRCVVILYLHFNK